MNSLEILDVGFDYLVEKLGIIDAEKFITIIKNDDFDYTKWRRSFFADKDVKTLNAEAVDYAENHPYTGKGIRL